MKTRIAFCLSLASLAISSGALAAPPTKDQCFDAHERAQQSVKEQKLRSARADFEICSQASCPKLVQEECKKSLVATENQSPSIQINAPGDATLQIDGGPLPEAAADGSIEIDPGEHTISVTAADGRTAEKRVTLQPGERNVKVELALPAPKAQGSPPTKPTEPDPAKARSGPSPLVYLLGGVAVVGLAGFTIFGLSGKSKQSDLDECKPDCQRDDVDSMRRSFLLADISLGVAVVAGGIGAYLYFSDKKKPTESVSWLSTAPRSKGAELRFGATF